MRNTRKKKGGNPPIPEHPYAQDTTQIQELQKYAIKMKNGENIEVATFKQYLDSIQDPLTIEFSVVGDGNAGQHTINEWAIIYDSPFYIHLLFLEYDVSLFRRVVYPYSIFYSNTPYTILEAYILQGKFIDNIDKILQQIGDDEYKIDNSLLYYIGNGDFPTVLQYAIEINSYGGNNIGVGGSGQGGGNILSKMICSVIIKKYSNIKIYEKLTKHKNSIFKLLNYAISNNVYEFITYIIMNIYRQSLYSNTDGLQIITTFLFHHVILEKIMVQDNILLYETIINAINLNGDDFIKDVVNNYINDGTQHTYIKSGKLNASMGRKFFKNVAKHTIDHLLIPSINKTPKIIIICHGSSFGRNEATYQFPFKKLCFFVGKGNKLLDECIVSKHVEQLICAGNYDKRLQCTEGVNGAIAIENMLFKFIPTTLDHAQNNTLGIYTCMNRKVEKQNIPLNEPYYTMEALIGLCSNICVETDILQEYVEIMMFVCRGYENEEENQEKIKAVPVISPESG